MGNRNRHGYSLGELLIVLAVLTALAGLSWPTVRGSLAKNRLQDSARRVRTELVRARLKAIRTGAVHRFRFQLDGSDFEVGRQQQSFPAEGMNPRLPNPDAVDVVESDSVGSESSTVTLSAVPIANMTSHSLPIGVRFAEAASARSMPFVSSDPPDSELPIESERGGSADDDFVSEFSPVLWSAPIIFYPDGRTRNAKILLLGERGFQIEVSLRGLTGTATVGELKRAVVVDLPSVPDQDEDAE